MADEGTFYIGMKVEEMPIPPILCHRGKCSECGEDVWLDENLRHIWESVPIFCMACIEVYIKEKAPKEVNLMITPEIRESLMKYFKRREELMKK